MSLDAFIWATRLPMNVVNGTAFRVLLHLADDANRDGRSAWGTISEIAESLGCNKRTVERGLHDLREAGLIKEGDQSAVAGVRADRRPKVYDLAMTPRTPPTAPPAPDRLSEAQVDLGGGLRTLRAAAESRPRTDTPKSIRGHEHTFASSGWCTGCPTRVDGLAA